MRIQITLNIEGIISSSFSLFFHIFATQGIQIKTSSAELMGDWIGVVVNGAEIRTNSAAELAALFFSACVAFNLIHPKGIESLIELGEYALKIRRRGTTLLARNLISTL